MQQLTNKELFPLGMINLRLIRYLYSVASIFRRRQFEMIRILMRNFGTTIKWAPSPSVRWTRISFHQHFISS